jgi:hypothetical protein
MGTVCGIIHRILKIVYVSVYFYFMAFSTIALTELLGRELND